MIQADHIRIAGIDDQIKDAQDAVDAEVLEFKSRHGHEGNMEDDIASGSYATSRH